MAALTYRLTTVNPFRRSCAICATALLLAVAGCGGDDEEDATPPAATTPVTTEPAGTATDQPADTSESDIEPGSTAPATSPETQTGGAGDEVAAESLALLTGSGGRITPRVVRVPAFISIRVELRSDDGGPYVLRFGRRTLAVRSELPSVSHRFDGLRPGAALVGRSATGAGNPVRIEATAEPGP
jgi:hypothetical protein